MSTPKLTLLLDAIRNRDNPLCYQSIKTMIEVNGFAPTDSMIDSCNPDDPAAEREWIEENTI